MERLPAPHRSPVGAENGAETRRQPEIREGALTLAAALSLALEGSEVVRVTSGGEVRADEATGYDIAIADARRAAALAAFDASWEAELYSTAIKDPPNAFFGPGLTQPTVRDEGSLTMGLNKRWFSGGRTAVEFNPDPAYLYLPSGGGSSFNPTYTGQLAFSVRQPLFRGAGRQVNEAPIRIRAIETEQSAWETKKAVLASARSVCDAYWRLYSAQVAVEAIDKVLPLLQELVRLQEESFRTEWVIEADVAKAYAQLYDFRQRRLAAQSRVRAAELELRNLLRLPPVDGWQISPATEPVRGGVTPDPETSIAMALHHQPDVVRLKLESSIRELEYAVARNGLRPQIDFRALYQMNGVGENVSSSIQQMFSGEYSDWLIGLSVSTPLGNRRAGAAERLAALQLARTNELLEQEAEGAANRVHDALRKIEFTFREYAEAERRRGAAAKWLEGARMRYENPRPGSEQNWLLASLNDYVYALRFYTEATADAAEVLARYNTAIVELEETKGTLLEFLGVDLIADPCRQIEHLPLR